VKTKGGGNEMIPTNLGNLQVEIRNRLDYRKIEWKIEDEDAIGS
jgi:hypothetical protein